MKTAVLSKQSPVGFQKNAVLVELNPPIRYRTQTLLVKPQNMSNVIATTQCIVVSFGIRTSDGKPETKVFPANEQGQCLSWLQLDEALEGHPALPDVLQKYGYQLVL